MIWYTFAEVSKIGQRSPADRPLPNEAASFTCPVTSIQTFDEITLGDSCEKRTSKDRSNTIYAPLLALRLTSITLLRIVRPG